MILKVVKQDRRLEINQLGLEALRTNGALDRPHQKTE